MVASSDRIQVTFRKASGTNWSVNAIEIREKVLSSNDNGQSASALVWPLESLVGIEESILPPLAMMDIAATHPGSPLRIDVLLNDVSYFGSLNSQSIEIVSSPISGSVSILEDGTLEFSPNELFVGQVSFAYRVRDELGITSNYGEVVVNVSEHLHQNFLDALDVNADSVVNPLDVLTLIDRINSQESTPLSSQEFRQNQWVDVNGNQSLDPLDVLMVIDYINQATLGNPSMAGGEAESAMEPFEATDTLVQVSYPPFSLEPFDAIYVTPLYRVEWSPIEDSVELDPIGLLDGNDDEAIRYSLEAILESDPDSLSDESIAEMLCDLTERGLSDQDLGFMK